MAENSKGTARGKGKPFNPGQSGNPGGRPKKTFELTERCREMTPAALEEIDRVLREGKGNDRLKAAEIILAYGYGKPVQRTELTGEDGGAVKSEYILPPELLGLIR